MTREEQLDWLCRLRSDILYLDFSIDMEVSLERKKQYRQALSEVIKNLEQEPKQQRISVWQQDHAILRAYSDGANEVLDKIRAEVIAESYPEDEESSFCKIVYLKDVLDIIDKYKVESEG